MEVGTRKDKYWLRNENRPRSNFPDNDASLYGGSKRAERIPVPRLRAAKKNWHKLQRARDGQQDAAWIIGNVSRFAEERVISVSIIAGWRCGAKKTKASKRIVRRP